MRKVHNNLTIMNALLVSFLFMEQFNQTDQLLQKQFVNRYRSFKAISTYNKEFYIITFLNNIQSIEYEIIDDFQSVVSLKKFFVII